MVRSMLKSKQMPKEFWAEAIACAVYLCNRSPTRSLHKITPQEAWSGKKPNVSHLRVFGSLAYVHVPDELRKKLDDKSRKLVFIGYDQRSKGYKLYDPENKKLIVSRDVQFDESGTWNWGIKEENYNLLPLSVDDEIDPAVEIPETPPHSSPSHDPNSSSSSSDGPRRVRQLSDLYEETDEVQAHFCLFADSETITFDEAVQDDKWRQAMDEEMKAILKNDTWEMATLPEGKQPVGLKWIFKIKKNEKGEVKRHKARLVARGFTQKAGIDYEEVFAPVARLETIRLVISLAAQHNWRIYQMDVKSAFLNGYLEEEVYVEQPPGYIIEGKEDKVLRLKRALYGLKQAPRSWYNRIDAYFLKNGFVKCPHEHAVYLMKNENGGVLLVCLYVDDLIFTGNDPSMFDNFKRRMTEEFEMTDLGLMTYYLGIEVKQSDEGIFISQKAYAEKVLKEFGMMNSKPVSTPMECGLKLSKYDEGEKVDPRMFRSLVGCLRYLTCTRPDIVYGVGIISRFMESPSSIHLKAAKRILRYMKGTIDYGIFYSATDEFELIGYSDSDWGGNIDDRKSTSGYVFYFGNVAFTWSSKKQEIVALSICEAEYVAAASCVCHGIWLRNLLEYLGYPQEEATPIHVDNKSAISLSKNPVIHGRSKHIDLRYHFIRESAAKKEVKLKYVKTHDQVADIFTKALKFHDFNRLRAFLGVTKEQV